MKTRIIPLKGIDSLKCVAKSSSAIIITSFNANVGMGHKSTVLSFGSHYRDAGDKKNENDFFQSIREVFKIANLVN